MASAARIPHAPELDTLAARWQVALDAADHALGAVGDIVPASELQLERHALALERQGTATLLARLASSTGTHPAPWLAPFPVSPRLLGLASSTRACLFDLDGVLTDSGVLHAHAWAEAFDAFLLRLAERTGWQFIPFDRDADYRAFVDGQPRLDGVHLFLASRGIHVPEGSPDDPPDADTANGVARRKSDAMGRSLRDRQLSTLDGARRYLEAAGHAGLRRAAVSASARTGPMLELAGLATLIDQQIDADVIRTKQLRARPAPDLLLEACDRLGIAPAGAVTLTHTPAGIAAGLAAGLTVIGVGAGPQGELLEGFGATRVVPSLGALLDPRLREIGHADPPR